ncbi:hypothetical protein K435DRAFT_804019 [Dendrothele bispora CBS 962.96]|uniref:Uncharacterized protein n=1 Tax=Dendrothele bispora (strain CBS 962.96) TaxID=1314807 RepID=A0A4S8LG04_DENBC|nr:hypothetical protein K435DRAFT_804019 [Dendrothele bispora CBS 962.96]
MDNPDPYPPPGYLERHPYRVVRGLPGYIDMALDDESRQMIHFIISNTARYSRIHLCPGYLRSGRPYHRLTMDAHLMDYDVKFDCRYCEHRERPGMIQEHEQRHLSRLSEAYRARAELRYDFTADPPVYLPPSRSLTPSPPRSPVPATQLPLPPSPPRSPAPAPQHPQPPSPPQIEGIAGPSCVSRTRNRAPAPYARPTSNADRFSGSGRCGDPIDLDGPAETSGSGTRSDPIDLSD